MRSIGLGSVRGDDWAKAGPSFFAGRERVLATSSFLGGIVGDALHPHCCLFLRRYVLRLNPALLVGGIAGAQR